ncbi:MAG: hypothetical protein K0U37_02210, partial [Gammaproteobacteria bacterium]|nr:hypothetical protein [Gammaproteobacteria bacterium]
VCFPLREREHSKCFKYPHVFAFPQDLNCLSTFKGNYDLATSLAMGIDKMFIRGNLLAHMSK